MANICIFTEFQGDTVKNVSLEILGKLTGHTVDVIGFGEFPAKAQEDLKSYGANKIIALKSGDLDKYSPEGYANGLAEYVNGKGYNYLFAGATPTGKDFLPRLSVKLESGMISEVTAFQMDGDTFKGIRPLYAGKCLAEAIHSGSSIGLVTVRPNALGMPDSPQAGPGTYESADINAGEIKAKIKEVIKGNSEKADLTEANYIVSGGRSLKSEENFKIIYDLADVIGATPGASRAAVDSGFAPPSMQVGQTGKTVAPSLYIACGISGAIQHLAGMRTSKVIVAINTDPDAPIFSKADYGIVGDLFKIVPIMTEEFKSLLS